MDSVLRELETGEYAEGETTGKCVEGETDWSLFLGRNTLDSVLREKQTGECVEGKTDWTVF